MIAWKNAEGSGPNIPIWTHMQGVTQTGQLAWPTHTNGLRIDGPILGFTLATQDMSIASGGNGHTTVVYQAFPPSQPWGMWATCIDTSGSVLFSVPVPGGTTGSCVAISDGNGGTYCAAASAGSATVSNLSYAPGQPNSCLVRALSWPSLPSTKPKALAKLSGNGALLVYGDEDPMAPTTTIRMLTLASTSMTSPWTRVYNFATSEASAASAGAGGVPVVALAPAVPAWSGYQLLAQAYDTTNGAHLWPVGTPSLDPIVVNTNGEYFERPLGVHVLPNGSHANIAWFGDIVTGHTYNRDLAGYFADRYSTATGAPGIVVAPENTFVTQPSSSGVVWRTAAFRTQMIYDTTHFTNQGVIGPISIDRLRFRAANNNTAAGGVYTGDGATFGVNLSIGTSLTDHLTPSTTFANNRGTMQTVLQNATVTVAAGAGTTPNNYVIDITIPGGFVYDPTLGNDLLIEFDAPTPAPSTIPLLATGVSQATSRCARVAAAGQATATGSITGQAAIVLFDISGGPGGIPTIVPGTVTSYGSGCYNGSRAFAELFPVAASTLDLGGGITLQPTTPGAPTAYVVTPGAGAFVAPTTTVPLLSNAATPAVMNDDATSVALNLTSFSFPYVGGSTNVLHATTNGEILLTAVTATGSDFTPTLTEMAAGTSTHAGRPRLFPCWYDLFANRNVTLNPLAGVHFQEDTVNQTATITWNDVGELATAAAGAKSFNIQVVLSATGAVEIRYGAMSTFGSTAQPKIVGFSPGTPVLVPASQDFSATMPFVSATTDVAPLTLAISPAPKLGISVNIITNNMPALGIGVNFFSTTQLPGIDLGSVGMPGCRVYVNPDIGLTLFGTPDASYSFPIPNQLSLIGLQLFSQSLALDSTQPNAFGAITSNGVAMTLGTVN